MGVKHPDWTITLEKLVSLFQIGPGVWVLHPFIACSHLRGGALLCLETKSPCFPHCALHLSCSLRMGNTGLEAKVRIQWPQAGTEIPALYGLEAETGALWVWGQPELETLYRSISQTESFSKGTESKKSFKLTFPEQESQRGWRNPHIQVALEEWKLALSVKE